MSDWKKQMRDQAPCHQKHPETEAQFQSGYPLHHPLYPCSKDEDAVTCGCCLSLWRSG